MASTVLRPLGPLLALDGYRSKSSGVAADALYVFYVAQNAAADQSCFSSVTKSMP